MSALSTPGGGGTTAQNKPTSGKQKFQKLDINSLYCANRNENSEPSLVKSQLSRKHGMQSLGKVPSARRPPANLPSLKTETGQDPNANSVSVTTTTVSTPSTCTTQTTTTTSSSAANATAGGWVALPPPSSPHFRTEFPSLEAAAQPSHRAADHTQPQPSLRPQTEGSWTCGGASREPAPAAAPPAQQTPAFRAILPPFLMKGSTSGSGLGLSGLSGLASGAGPATRGPAAGGAGAGGAGPARGPPRPARAPPPRAPDVHAQRPILREEQISSLDDIRDAGWAQHDDIDYDQKLDFSDGESSAATGKSGGKGSGGRAPDLDTRGEPGDEEQLWAERRQKQNNDVAMAVARARLRKEEEQRRQIAPAHEPDSKEHDARGPPKERSDNRDRPDNRDRLDNRDRDRGRDSRDRNDLDKNRIDARERDRFDRDRERTDRGERDRERPDRERVERDRPDRDRQDRDRQDRDRHDRERQDRDRQEWDRQEREHQDRDRSDRDRADRERNDRNDRDRNDRNDRDRSDRSDRDFRERDRDYGRDRAERERGNPSNPAFSKTFQANIPPRFQKQQAAGRQDGWAFSKQPPPRRADVAPRHNRRSFSRDSDREDEYRREPGPQWRSEMQDYDRPRELDRSNSKDSYKDYDYKDRKSESERKSIDGNIEPSSRTAADKLSEVFERKSVGVLEPFAASENSQPPAQERRVTPPATHVQRESVEKDFGMTSWADVAQDEANKHAATKPTLDPLRVTPPRTSPPRASPDPNLISSTAPKFLASHQPAQNFSHPPSQNNSNTTVVPSPAMPLYQNRTTAPADVQITQKSIDSLNQNPNDPSLSSISKSGKPPLIERLPQNGPSKSVPQKVDKEIVEPVAPAAQSVPAQPNIIKPIESAPPVEARRPPADDRRNERYGNDQSKVPGKEPVERKSSGSGSEKKGRRYSSSGYAVYGRGWVRETRGRRAGRSSRSHTRASESDASTDTGPSTERRRRRAAPDTDEPFAPRGQPSRRGRGGGFQHAPRAPAPPKRVAGYGPPNTKSPFSQAQRVKDDETKDNTQLDDKNRPVSKGRTGSTGGRGRERRARGPGGPPSGEEDNWETTSEHSEGGGAGARRRSGNRQLQGPPGKGPVVRGPAGPPRPNGRGPAPPRNDGKPDVADAMTALKISTKKDEEVVDDGFQEVRNKKNSKDARGPPTKEEIQHAQKPRSHSNQGAGRTGSSSRNPNDKSNQRGSAPVPGKSGPQYERNRQVNLAPRFVKQRQKQQMGLSSSIGPDTGAAPPPPTVNAWDKPIAQTLRGNVEEQSDSVEARPTPMEVADAKPAPLPATPCSTVDKTGALDGTTPPVETIIFENTNYKSTPPAEALKQKYQPSANAVPKPAVVEEPPAEVEARPLAYNGDARPPTRSIQELIDNGQDAPAGLALPMQFEPPPKQEDSSDMKLDFAFDSDLGQLTEDKANKPLGLPRGVHMSTSNTISPLAADLNQKIASVKKVWEMPAVVEGTEDLQFTGFEEGGAEPGAPPNVCKVKPTQQLQSPPPQHYNHMGYQGGYGGLSVSSPPAVMFNSSQQLLGSSQQLPQQGGLYGFLDQSRGQFGGFPASPYAAGSAAPYNYQPADMFQSLPNQYRMAAAAGAGAFGQSGQLGNSPSTVLISSTSNSLMSATVKPSSQQIGAIGSKGGGVGGVGGVNTFQQQYLGYSGPEQYSLQGLIPRPAPPTNSYYSHYQPGAGGAPTYPLQFPQAPQSGAFGSQFISSQLQVAAAAAAVQQMQQQYRAPMQQQFARPLKSPLHEHNGMAEAAPSPKPPQKPKPPHSPPHKYHPHPQHYPQHPHQHMVAAGPGGRGGGRAARYPAPIQRPPAPAPAYRPPARHPPPPRHNLYYHQPRNGGGLERAPDAAGDEGDAPPPDAPAEAASAE